MQKKPFVSPEKLREIAAVYPTPFHLYDEAGHAPHRARRCSRAFAWNTGYREYLRREGLPQSVHSADSQGGGLRAWTARPWPS